MMPTGCGLLISRQVAVATSSWIGIRCRVVVLSAVVITALTMTSVVRVAASTVLDRARALCCAMRRAHNDLGDTLMTMKTYMSLFA